MHSIFSYSDLTESVRIRLVALQMVAMRHVPLYMYMVIEQTVCKPTVWLEYNNIGWCQCVVNSQPPKIIPDSKVHGANMGPISGRQDPDGPHVGPMNLAIWDTTQLMTCNKSQPEHYVAILQTQVVFGSPINNKTLVQAMIWRQTGIEPMLKHSIGAYKRLHITPKRTNSICEVISCKIWN